jgi:high-affinity nickel-transport protein
MLIADTLDSQIVARLLRTSGRTPALVRRYRRGVGWLVVCLSFGMAGYALAEMAGWNGGLSDRLFTATGIGASALIILLLARGRWLGRRSASV